jgi:hypothetical protein
VPEEGISLSGLSGDLTNTWAWTMGLPGRTGMSAAALTPRVRILVLCDEVVESETEEGVFTLEGVRQQLVGDAFPLRASLNLFVVLFSARTGNYRGNVVVVNARTDKAIRYLKFQVGFDSDSQIVPMAMDLGSCAFPEPGPYMIQVWFSPGEGQDVLKAELPFNVFQTEE